ncbi:Di-copper centre-containing protein [Aspergillus pseudoustus]|uniref:Di-copper centre-containing protein n=1 Tax=Aspergillus pseudoustus TaxID=1810923 RepID=A0ABR4KEI1_9EURO
MNDNSSGKAGKSNVKVNKCLNELYSQQSANHTQPYIHIAFSQQNALEDVITKLWEAGPKVEDALLEIKEQLEAGLNPDLLREAMSIYLTHSPDAQERHIHAPPLKEHAVFKQYKSEAEAKAADPVPITVSGEIVTADTLQGPGLLSYWRDDYDLNDAHYHWHIVFRGAGGNNAVNTRTINRQGELFLYTHSQMLARYEVECLCWDQPLVRSWNLYDEVLEWGYQPVPALQEYYSGYKRFSSWYRIRNPDMKDVPGVTIGVGDMEEWRDNIYEAVKRGYLTTKKVTKNRTQYRPLPLTGENILNYIGGVLDAQYKYFDNRGDGFEIDQDLYGILYCFGLGKFAEMSYSAANDGHYGLMISNFGAARDPCFYLWHKHMQDFGRLAGARYPQDITQYRAEVILSNLVVRPQDTKHPLYSEGGVVSVLTPPATDMLETKAKLDHEPYEWSVDITSSKAPSREDPQHVTLRFFIAAKELVNHYHHWIEMDKVTVTLTDSSVTTKVRLDSESSVARKLRNYSESDPAFASSWCRCGWPQNMMLPAGRTEGMSFVGFCMATDDTLDTENSQTPSISFCGANVKAQTYPDPRGMGYPFDRAWSQLTDAETGKISLASIIGADKPDNPDYPFLTSSEFKIFRTYNWCKAQAVPPPTDVTWHNTIKYYFKERDIACMRSEYGYSLGQYEDVVYHHANIYEATVSGRMPLQMAPYTQKKPDPEHPLWTAEMCENFRAWMLNKCPEGVEDEPRTLAVRGGKQ